MQFPYFYWGCFKENNNTRKNENIHNREKIDALNTVSKNNDIISVQIDKSIIIKFDGYSSSLI